MADNIREKLTRILASDTELLKDLNASVIKLRRLVTKMLDNGVTIQEWIPVSESPEESGEYIVAIKGAANATTLLYGDDFWFEEDEKGWRTFYPVTHWMPLPTPPKGE